MFLSHAKIYRRLPFFSAFGFSMCCVHVTISVTTTTSLHTCGSQYNSTSLVPRTTSPFPSSKHCLFTCNFQTLPASPTASTLSHQVSICSSLIPRLIFLVPIAVQCPIWQRSPHAPSLTTTQPTENPTHFSVKMPAKWTSERNERLFMLIIQDVKLNYEKIQKDWKERYGMHHLIALQDSYPSRHHVSMLLHSL